MYYGDFDPWGVKKIADNLPNHIRRIEQSTGLSLSKMIYDRVGLTEKFIDANDLPWIDNLISGSGNPPNYNDPDIKDWIRQYGERKVEANAIILHRDEAINDLYQTILKYLDRDCVNKYKAKIVQEQSKIKAICNIKEIAFYDYIDAFIELLKKNKFKFERVPQ